MNSANFEPLAGGGPNAPLSIEGVIRRVTAGEPFSAIKLCHGFWEHCVRFERTRESLGLEHPLTRAQWSEVIGNHRVNWPAELLLEVRDRLARANERPGVLNLFSALGWTDGYEIEGTPRVGLAPVQRLMREMLHPDAPIHDGLLWKTSVENGSFATFLSVLEQRPVVIVGPSHVADFGRFARLADHAFVECDGRRAAWARHALRDAIATTVEDKGSRGIVCLLQTGGLTSAWLVHELATRYPDSWFFSLGRTLDLAHHEILSNTNWYAAHGTAIERTCRAINPGWIDPAHRALTADPELAWRWRSDKREPAIRSVIDRPAVELGKRPVDFIGEKPIDEPLLRDLLALSHTANHWTNFGPVNRRFEQSIQALLSLPADREVVSCKSATDALHLLVHSHELEAGRALKWVTSAFGFFSTRTGPLSAARLVDCDEQGVIDLDALRALPTDDWDGVVIVNPFALARDLEPLLELARHLGKRVIVDNAAALFTPTRRGADYPDEAISFHHTKPWGMGEGGCAIVSSRRAGTLRALTNFGVGLDANARVAARNAKLSEFDAALVLQRLANLPSWRRLYEMQRRRILSIAEPLGLTPLGPERRWVLQAHVPLLAPAPVAPEALANPVLTLRKYYRPLETGHRVAQDLFDRIVCVPCHDGVASVETGQIRKLLLRFAGNDVPIS